MSKTYWISFENWRRWIVRCRLRIEYDSYFDLRLEHGRFFLIVVQYEIQQVQCFIVCDLNQARFWCRRRRWQWLSSWCSVYWCWRCWWWWRNLVVRDKMGCIARAVLSTTVVRCRLVFGVLRLARDRITIIRCFGIWARLLIADRWWFRSVVLCTGWNRRTGSVCRGGGDGGGGDRRRQLLLTYVVGFVPIKQNNTYNWVSEQKFHVSYV